MFLEEIADNGTLFLRMWAKVKEEKTGKKTRIKKLGEKEERLLRKHIKAGYTLKEFEEATNALFNDPNKYAILNGLDVPLHLLRNFVNYLEKFEDAKHKERAPENPQPKENKDFLTRDEWAAACWETYQKSLTAGNWLGTIAHAAQIGEKLAEYIPEEVKPGLWAEARKEREELEAKKSTFVKPMELADFNLKTALNIYKEKITVEAIKRNVNPWKRF